MATQVKFHPITMSDDEVNRLVSTVHNIVRSDKKCKRGADCFKAEKLVSKQFKQSEKKFFAIGMLWSAYMGQYITDIVVKRTIFHFNYNKGCDQNLRDEFYEKVLPQLQ